MSNVKNIISRSKEDQFLQMDQNSYEEAIAAFFSMMTMP